MCLQALVHSQRRQRSSGLLLLLAFSQAWTSCFERLLIQLCLLMIIAQFLLLRQCEIGIVKVHVLGIISAKRCGLTCTAVEKVDTPFLSEFLKCTIQFCRAH